MAARRDGTIALTSSEIWDPNVTQVPEQEEDRRVCMNGLHFVWLYLHGGELLGGPEGPDGEAPGLHALSMGEKAPCSRWRAAWLQHGGTGSRSARGLRSYRTRTGLLGEVFTTCEVRATGLSSLRALQEVSRRWGTFLILRETGKRFWKTPASCPGHGYSTLGWWLPCTHCYVATEGRCAPITQGAWFSMGSTVVLESLTACAGQSHFLHQCGEQHGKDETGAQGLMDETNNNSSSSLHLSM
ncbi:unnamed protein product [Boreogadus saida]